MCLCLCNSVKELIVANVHDFRSISHLLCCWFFLQVFIQIENVNDNAPLTEHPVYYPSVAESSPAGVKVLQLIAEDGDNDPLQKITYRITSGNPEGFFAINSTSGE